MSFKSLQYICSQFSDHRARVWVQGVYLGSDHWRPLKVQGNEGRIRQGALCVDNRPPLGPSEPLTQEMGVLRPLWSRLLPGQRTAPNNREVRETAGPADIVLQGRPRQTGRTLACACFSYFGTLSPSEHFLVSEFPINTNGSLCF